ncbi:uncharacterized protein BT62DRAFT_939008 [Guyanagaster necrorhizus]|uniref:Uncharacterized protein n=1 Tax=Guyanagaster necrorhizus TaxID=856835 RepID=A0A9P7VFW6_9AGAR|nr:uncharacterized protein BT62DRAFT_939008 [Guyanagaster necrorhizus MCA 3950]KAG7439406.1 hypothetical protein BT62DRAFT_939008 [Guyanagaster necrorhizus MCA 3950]
MFTRVAAVLLILHILLFFVGRTLVAPADAIHTLIRFFRRGKEKQETAVANGLSPTHLDIDHCA